MKFWWKRYEPILEAKPVAAEVVLRDLVAQEAAEMCAHFPPDEAALEWVDPALEGRLAGRLSELPRPDAKMVAVLARLVRWDLEHDIEAVDHFFRNDHHRDACPTEDHVATLHFLWRGILELFAQRKEEAGGRLKRADLIEAADALPAQHARLMTR